MVRINHKTKQLKTKYKHVYQYKPIKSCHKMLQMEVESISYF